eukprot:SAG31_NODE_4867_length_2899_cov_1.889643_1_plen_41_part_10
MPLAAASCLPHPRPLPEAVMMVVAALRLCAVLCCPLLLLAA